jgi:hypothetical protein
MSGVPAIVVDRLRKEFRTVQLRTVGVRHHRSTGT